MVASVASRVSSGVVEVTNRPIETLRSRIAGEVFTPADLGYDVARTTLYTSDRHPFAVVRAANALDVAETVKFAVEREFPLAVRSGGHSLAQYSVINGAVVADLSQMKRVQIDPETRTAKVQAGATSGDLAGPAGEHGLALSTGDTASVGMGGLTTGGGIGFMARKYGLAIDSLLEAQIVTANGEILTANESQNAELFWAIRGGGGNAGIVTEFTYQLAEVPQILGGMIAIPATKETLRAYLDFSVAAPEELTTLGNLMYAPPLPFVPEDQVGKLVIVILVCWAGDIEQGQKTLAQLRAIAEPVIDMVGPMPYPEIYRMTDHQSEPHGASIRSMFAHQVSDETIDAIFESMSRPSSPMSIVHFRAMGGAISRVPVDATAFAHRSEPYFVTILNLWPDPAEDRTPHEAWTNELFAAMRRDASGVYVNFLEDEGADRVREAYPGATYERLAEVKRAYDPENVFRFNQNVAPKR